MQKIQKFRADDGAEFNTETECACGEMPGAGAVLTATGSA